MDDGEPVLPAYGGACVTNVVRALLEPTDPVPAWLPEPAAEAEQVVLLVLDGLGWEQLQQRRDVAPTLASLAGGPITTVVPSTTSTALTSIATGLTPGEHGVVGYRMAVDGDILNVLRWSVDGRDARETIPPEKIQSQLPFLGHRPAVVTKADFKSSGFTEAHLESVRFSGYRVPSTMIVEVRRLLAENEPFVYAYYDGVDKVAHEYGLGDHYDEELRFVDRLVADLLGVLPAGAALVITSDHGQVDVGESVVRLDPEVLANTALQSGEGRFRWLHARPGRAAELLAAAQERHGEEAWVLPVEQLIQEGWLGPRVLEPARSRLGDVAIVARKPVAFFDPDDTGPYVLIGRHGSVTRAEMLVPLLAGQG
ncbi:MAG: alkaline phosphatase family protein [Acidimicrobiales bacterium]|nr:alkaline phosphatase family protein [Acidimicrobiales bacterium]